MYFSCSDTLAEKGYSTYPLNVSWSDVKAGPILSNNNLQKERPVCISFTFEGYGDHYERSRVIFSDMTTAVRYLSSTAFFFVSPVCNHGVELN
ncbi:hypothetical protein DAPPUDRAFT_232994 [Daphnia pulex]|uniref:Uncharacterized protein n=1 Tax=Daphnia pulex TaxID=6669 RepID=E9FSW9_DAPPU|nr:hypothetical protein DAPPUDRAFT_232994 [Daphnia pulex]|eukprot:EFX89744.1 hypothetical protein DAPPUDRAFT_232994 [Daphnia pulex]